MLRNLIEELGRGIRGEHPGKEMQLMLFLALMLLEFDTHIYIMNDFFNFISFS